MNTMDITPHVRTEQALDRLNMVLDNRDMSTVDLSNLLDEANIEPNATGTVRKYLRLDSVPRLNWLLSVADLLNVDYRWLLTGSDNGWDEMPRETVIIHEDSNPVFAFDVPKGWPYLNFRAYIQNIPEGLEFKINSVKE